MVSEKISKMDESANCPLVIPWLSIIAWYWSYWMRREIFWSMMLFECHIMRPGICDMGTDGHSSRIRMRRRVSCFVITTFRCWPFTFPRSVDVEFREGIPYRKSRHSQAGCEQRWSVYAGLPILRCMRFHQLPFHGQSMRTQPSEWIRLHRHRRWSEMEIWMAGVLPR